LSGLRSRKPIEVRASDTDDLEDSLLHLLVFDKSTVDPEVGVVLVMLLSYQELLSELGYLRLIME